MAEDEVPSASSGSPAPADHKRKLEVEAPEPLTADLNASAPDSDNEKEGHGVAMESEAKRPRLDHKPDDGQSAENGYQEEGKVNEPKEETEAEELAENIAQVEGAQEGAKEALDSVSEDHPAADNQQEEKTEQQLSAEKPTEVENTQEDKERPSTEAPSQENVYPLEEDTSDTQTTSRKMEVPNNKVGVLIGKAGDTIRYLQYNSGAKIQITRDADADPHSATRSVELIGTLESISKAEKLIKDVIAEADAGGSPALVARGFSTVQDAGAGEQLMIPVPNEKVGLIIGKGGETIKNLQTRSGARIQLIPQHLPEGDQSKERVVRVTGDKKQIEIAKDMIKEVMNQPIRPSPLSSGYSQQAFRPRGPAASQWGPRYDYQQRGPYPSQNPQYPPTGYGSYHQQQIAPRGGFGPGWEQRSSAGMQGPPQQAGGYDYYGGQGGHMGNVTSSVPVSTVHTHASGPLPGSAMGMPSSQANYGYGQPQGPDYGYPTPYSQSAPLAQGYGQGYSEGKYENAPAAQPHYGGRGGSHPSAYPQGGMHPGYGPQDQYGKPPSYGIPPQGLHSQSYGQPRASQPGDMPYQGSTQPYGPNVPSQQSYPYTSSGLMQQTYPAYGAAPSADGYGPQPPAGYSQQAGQPASGYVQPGGQQAAGYAQSGQMGGYSSYPITQPGYTEQPATDNAGYGYQGPTDPAYSAAGPGSTYAAPPAGQPGYTQSALTQPGYDQSVPQSGGYGTTPAAGYSKSVSPQPNFPQYDSSQMYGAPH